MRMADRARAVFVASHRNTATRKARIGRRNSMRKNLIWWMTNVGAVLIVGTFGTAKAETRQQSPSEAPPVTLNAVPNGTHFLVGLDDELDTGKHKVNKKFEAKTLEPL